jgi:hypothetical protein
MASVAAVAARVCFSKNSRRASRGPAKFSPKSRTIVTRFRVPVRLSSTKGRGRMRAAPARAQNRGLGQTKTSSQLSGLIALSNRSSILPPPPPILLARYAMPSSPNSRPSRYMNGCATKRRVTAIR